jgi:hypothetical protein
MALMTLTLVRDQTMNSRTIAWMSLVAVCLLAASSLAMAHHGVPGYDISKPVNLEGTIVQLRWKNPHVYFTIEVRGADGKPRRLEIEAPSPARVNGFGTPREALEPGRKVKVVAFGRLKNPDGANYKGVTVTLPDGMVYALERQPGRELARETIDAKTLAGKWVPASMDNLTIYRLADMRARAASGGAPGGTPSTSCTALAKEPLPFVMGASGGLREIEIGKKAVVIRIDSNTGVLRRVIDLEQAAHPARVVPTLPGHSIGRWEGDTLVIDTVGFEPRPADAIGGVGPRRHLVERLTLAEDRRHIRYELTVEDPDFYPAPFQFSMLWTHRPDLALAKAKCDDRIARKYLSVD